ncbi:Interactor of constitutive active ROPs 2, chloroplastic, partial [Cucurbita argyrosperma subsp. argyrosperma]
KLGNWAHNQLKKKKKKKKKKKTKKKKKKKKKKKTKKKKKKKNQCFLHHFSFWHFQFNPRFKRKKLPGFSHFKRNSRGRLPFSVCLPNLETLKALLHHSPLMGPFGHCRAKRRSKREKVKGIVGQTTLELNYFITCLIIFLKETHKHADPKSKVTQRKSPRTPRTARQLKTPAIDPDSVSTSPLAASKTPKERSPRVVTDRKSPRCLAAELAAMRLESDKSKSALSAAETRFEEESVRTAMQIRIAHELVEQMKVESCQKEEELDAELKEARKDIEQLREDLKEKETQLCSVVEVNKDSELAMELKKLEADMAELKTKLLDKETELQSTSEENNALKNKIQNIEMEMNRINDEAVTLAETTKAAEQEADKNGQRAARAAEQLDAAQAANAEMEAELRRLKVQTDQWRKAAEAAAAILSTGNNGKLVDRIVSLENNYPLGSPYSEDLDDESPKKKNGNMLKKIGVLWRKNHK